MLNSLLKVGLNRLRCLGWEHFIITPTACLLCSPSRGQRRRLHVLTGSALSPLDTCTRAHTHTQDECILMMLVNEQCTLYYPHVQKKCNLFLQNKSSTFKVDGCLSSATNRLFFFNSGWCGKLFSQRPSSLPFTLISLWSSL